jgi:hypothetical protein
LRGDAGIDVFVWNKLTESGAVAGSADTVSDFAAGDVLDVASLDAMAGTAGNNAFKFIGTAAFSAEGQIRATASGGATIVELNTVGAAGAEMAIVLNGLVPLAAGDFAL